MHDNDVDIEQMYKIAEYVCRHVPSRFKEDYVQECVIKQYKSLAYFDNRSKLSTFLNTVARNRLKDLQTHHRAKISKELLSGHTEIPCAIFEQGFADVELRLVAEQAIKKICNPKHRLVAQTILDNPTHTHEEIGQILGISRKQVGGIVFRILDNLNYEKN